MVIIVGLGNVGQAYENTFHNIGFCVVEKLAEKLGTNFTKEKYKSFLAEARYNGQNLLLCKPTTFMNYSGEAVMLLKKKFKDARIIVAVDDIDLEKGAIRYREHGSSGTHNGLRSIVSYIGEDFERVRIGIGRDKSKELADYVLSKLNEEDKKILSVAIENAATMILEKISQ